MSLALKVISLASCFGLSIPPLSAQCPGCRGSAAVGVARGRVWGGGLLCMHTLDDAPSLKVWRPRFTRASFRRREV